MGWSLGLGRLAGWVVVCLAPLLLGAALTADAGQLRGSRPLSAPVPPVMEKLLDLRRSLLQGPERPFPAPLGYRLPWSAAVGHVVTQGPGEDPTHQWIRAWDFDLSYELVLAARGGRVAMVRDSERIGGCDSAYGGRANYVVIDHGDGTSALYLHIDYQGALVQEGWLVAQGAPIAYSGSSGLSCGGGGWAGPHLHFQVQRTVPGKVWTETLPMTFDELDGDTLVTGGGYVSRNLPTGFIGRVLVGNSLRRPARGQEVYVPPSRSFLTQLSNSTEVVLPYFALPTPVPMPTATPTPIPDWWLGPVEWPPVIPVPKSAAPAAVPAQIPVPSNPPPAPATPTPIPGPTG